MSTPHESKFTNLPDILGQDFDNETRKIAEIANAGFVLAFDINLKGPAYFVSTYPVEWQLIYDEENYSARDPILIYSIVNIGDRRWSENPMLIEKVGHRVMSHAKEFGLNYGGNFSRFDNNMRSILAVAKHDRELSDEEMRILGSEMDRINTLVHNDPKPSPQLLETLRLAANGLSESEITAHLNLGAGTVKKQLTTVRRILKARNTAHAASTALRRGWIR